MTRPRMPGQPVDLPLPPDLPRAFGYRGDARFVTFAWSHWSGDVLIDDGCKTTPGEDATFSAYLRHPAVAPLLRGLGLEVNDSNPSSALVIDTVRNLASVAPVYQARVFVRQQHAKRQASEQEPRNDLVQHLEALVSGCPQENAGYEQAMRRLQAQRGRHSRLMGWLDQCPVPPDRGRS